MATITRLKVGQTLYAVIRQQMGNTTLRRGALYPVVVVEINPEHRWVRASINGNAPQRYSAARLAKWKVNKPKPKRTMFGLPDY